MQNFNLNIEQQLARNTLLTLTYAGSVGRHLAYVADLNQKPITTDPTARVYPYAQQYPYLTAINQVNSGANSNYNSLQVSLVQAQSHGISARAYYTWSKSLDDSSSATTPQDSHNLRGDYGLSSFDVRNNFIGSVRYAVPKFTNFAPA